MRKRRWKISSHQAHCSQKSYCLWKFLYIIIDEPKKNENNFAAFLIALLMANFHLRALIEAIISYNIRHRKIFFSKILLFISFIFSLYAWKSKKNWKKFFFFKKKNEKFFVVVIYSEKKKQLKFQTIRWIISHKETHFLIWFSYSIWI